VIYIAPLSTLAVKALLIFNICWITNISIFHSFAATNGTLRNWRHRVKLSRGAARRVGLETDAKTGNSQPATTPIGVPKKAFLIPLSQWRLLAAASVMKIGDFYLPTKLVSLWGDSGRWWRKKRWLPCCDAHGYFTNIFIKFGFFVSDLGIFEGGGYFRRVQKYVLYRCHSFSIVGMK
jgi:hypothetical protein